MVHSNWTAERRTVVLGPIGVLQFVDDSVGFPTRRGEHLVSLTVFQERFLDLFRPLVTIAHLDVSKHPAPVTFASVLGVKKAPEAVHAQVFPHSVRALSEPL